MLVSWEHQQRIQLEEARRAELPIAAFQALFANANRDSKTKPFSPSDFTIFGTGAKDGEAQLSGAAASALISLHADERLHPLLLSCWSSAIQSPHKAPMPEVRALVSADESVWVIAPEWEGGNCRGLVCVAEFVTGAVVLHDIDRPLITHRLIIPRVTGGEAGWIEAGRVLCPAT